MKNIEIRRGRAPDCKLLLKLINTSAMLGNAPEQVTVSPEHFLESGFGINPGMVGVLRRSG